MHKKTVDPTTDLSTEVRRSIDLVHMHLKSFDKKESLSQSLMCFCTTLIDGQTCFTLWLLCKLSDKSKFSQGLLMPVCEASVANTRNPIVAESLVVFQQTDKVFNSPALHAS